MVMAAEAVMAAVMVAVEMVEMEAIVMPNALH